MASGDPNLSGRIQADGTLAFENEDHSYDGSPDTKAVAGDPLLVIRELAGQVAAHGVKQIEGRVLVDATLFPEGDRELGTNVVVSPISVNDNVVDLTVSPGSEEDAAVGMSVSPASSYASFVNKITTGPAGSKPDIKPPADLTNADGSHTVTLTGKFPLGGGGILYTYTCLLYTSHEQDFARYAPTRNLALAGARCCGRSAERFDSAGFVLVNVKNLLQHGHLK